MESLEDDKMEKWQLFNPFLELEGKFFKIQWKKGTRTWKNLFGVICLYFFPFDKFELDFCIDLVRIWWHWGLPH
jgi:hypothetical protein